jgi:transposase-like protein
MYLEEKIDKRSIAKLLDVSPNTLYVWFEGAEAMKRHFPKPQKVLRF